jgi:hypothetical protein
MAGVGIGARRMAHGEAREVLARSGLVARGATYILVGYLALQIAFGHTRREADRSGALHTVAASRGGSVLLALLLIGFVGMALWRFSEAAYGGTGRKGRKAGHRLVALGKGVFYSAVAVSTLALIRGHGGPKSTNKQSKDWTARALHYSGGRLAVIAVGVVLVGVGLWWVKRGLARDFRKKLMLGRMSRAERRGVETVGVVGSVARGVVFAAAGVFLVTAAVRYDPQEAHGIDATLRSFAHTPVGPWLLVAVAVGLVAFGLYSFAEARWRRV